MLYLICTTIASVDLAQYGVYRAKDWVSVNCGTKKKKWPLTVPLSKSPHTLITLIYETRTQSQAYDFPLNFCLYIYHAHKEIKQYWLATSGGRFFEHFIFL